MKKMLNIFSRGNEGREAASAYFFKEPTLEPSQNFAANNQGILRSGKSSTSQDAQSPATVIPSDFAGIIAYFHKTVSERKSPYNALVQSADRLQEFIPDEIGRLRAAFAICGDQWPHDVLSLAINTHIADIELAREKAKSSKGNVATDRATSLQQQADQIHARNAKIQEEIDALNASICQHQEKLDTNNADIAAINQQLHLTQADANSVTFIDQAADKLKNDLLAKKTLLGLP